jgi:hypothetical protein
MAFNKIEQVEDGGADGGAGNTYEETNNSQFLVELGFCLDSSVSTISAPPYSAATRTPSRL